MLVPAGTPVLHRDCCTVDIDLAHSRIRGRVSGTSAPLISVTPMDYDRSRTRPARSPQRPAHQPCSTRSHQPTMTRPLTRRPILDNRRSRPSRTMRPPGAATTGTAPVQVVRMRILYSRQPLVRRWLKMCRPNSSSSGDSMRARFAQSGLCVPCGEWGSAFREQAPRVKHCAMTPCEAIIAKQDLRTACSS